MNVQMELFQNETKIKEQRKYLHLLIELKSQEIQEQEFHNFWGTSEQINLKRMEANKKVNNFVQKVIKAFPGVL